MIGKVVSHYKILEKLGEGGMGVVYRARDTKLDRDVALKFLPPRLSISQEEISRFEQEAKAISSLNHPSIATIFDIDEVDGQKYLVLEYIPRGTLKARIRDFKAQDKQFTIAEVLELGVQISEGLLHAHTHGITHRDLKSDNIMFTEEGHAKIADFGLAKLRGGIQLTKSGSTVGTAGYASPEQIRGEDVDQRTDIFSCGVVLYELLTSHLPFRGDFEAAVTYSILNDVLIPARSLRSETLASLDNVVRRCLEKDRNLRYESAEDLLVDLRRVQAETSVRAGPTARKLRTPWIAAGVVAVVAFLAFFLSMTFWGPKPQVERSIAVLPFRNLSDDKEDEYFADGLTEDIITELVRMRGIGKVIARTSVMQYKGVDRSVREIGHELSVATVLEGSYRRVGDRVRVVAQLINVSNEDHLWAETYDRDLTQIFEIQSSVARQIAGALQVQYASGQGSRIGERRTESIEAYKLYLKGRHHWNKRTGEDLRKAIGYFNQAIDEDPVYADAYGGLAITYAVLSGYIDVSTSDTGPRLKAAARKALELDKSLAEPHAALGFFAFWYAGDWSEGRRELESALELSPNDVTANHWYSHYLTSVGRSDEAIAHIKRVMDMDPVSRDLTLCEGNAYYYARRYDEAIATCQKALAFDSTVSNAHWLIADCWVAQSMYDKAFDQLRRLGDPDVEQLREAYQKAGTRGFWQKQLELAFDSPGVLRVPPEFVGGIYSQLGMNDRAFEWLDECRKKGWPLVHMKVDPNFDNVRSDPRFGEFLRTMGLHE